MASYLTENQGKELIKPSNGTFLDQQRDICTSNQVAGQHQTSLNLHAAVPFLAFPVGLRNKYLKNKRKVLKRTLIYDADDPNKQLYKEQ